MARALQPHVITPACPLTCIEGQVPAKAYEAVRRHFRRQRVYHPTVRHVVALYRRTGLQGIRGLGAQGIELTTAFLETAGLVPARPRYMTAVIQQRERSEDFDCIGGDELRSRWTRACGGGVL